MAKAKKIKVAFPHMGTISIAWAAGLKKIGVEPYVPPYTSKKTLSLGTKHSPEAICLPYKLILGNFIEAIEGGTDYVAMITSPGCCMHVWNVCSHRMYTWHMMDLKYLGKRTGWRFFAIFINM